MSKHVLLLRDGVTAIGDRVKHLVVRFMICEVIRVGVVQIAGVIKPLKHKRNGYYFFTLDKIGWEACVNEYYSYSSFLKIQF